MRRRLITKAQLKHYLPAIIAVVIMGCIGSYLLIGSHAATQTASVEPENGSVSSAGATVNDSTASNNGAIKFGSGSTGGGGTSACPAYPAFPNASCTGYAHTGTTLTKVPSQKTSGTGWSWNGTNVVTTVANATISGLDINGGFQDNKGGVTFTNSWVRCTGLTTDDACASFSPGATVSDVEFGGCASGTATCGAGIYTGGDNSGNVFTRINIHGTADGMRTDGGTTLIDSYIHNLYYGPDPRGNTVHGDGSQTTQGKNMVFRHNYIEGGSNDALFFKTDDGPIGNITVTQNHLVGTKDPNSSDETSFGLGLTGDCTNVTVTNNVFGGNGAPAGIYTAGLTFNSTTWNGNKTDSGSTVAAPVY